MKVLVMSEEQFEKAKDVLVQERAVLWANWRNLESIDSAAANRDADRAVILGDKLEGLRAAHAAMTVIDIPDGCKLMVIDARKGIDAALVVQEVM